MNDIIKWIATIVTLVGAILVSLDVQPWSIYMMNLGAFLFLVWAILVKEIALIIVNVGLLLIYTIGTLSRTFSILV